MIQTDKFRQPQQTSRFNPDKEWDMLHTKIDKDLSDSIGSISQFRKELTTMTIIERIDFLIKACDNGIATAMDFIRISKLLDDKVKSDDEVKFWTEQVKFWTNERKRHTAKKAEILNLP